MRCPHKRNTYIRLPHPACLHISAAAPPPRPPRPSVVHHLPPLTSIVGYQGQTANATRNTMMAPTFLNVGSTTGCTLADLSVTGYEKPVLIDEEEGEYEGGCAGGDFILQFLNNNGTVAARYYWIDDGETTPGWYSSALGAAIDGGASSVAIKAGVASWVIGSGMTLQSAGAVNTKDVALPMNATRNTAAGNCMPIDLTLAKLTVDGYEEPVLVDEEEGEYEGGCAGGDFIIQFLNNNGTVAARYYWIDDGETTPGWYSSALGAAIDGGATSIAIPAGKGAWIIGTGKTLNIPAPTL